MNVYIGADHRGFELKEKLKVWLLSQKHEVIDCGNTILDPLDDFPDFSFAVAERVSEDPKSLGIIICGSGGGVTIAANKVKGIRCATVAYADEVKHNRANNDINMIALAADYTSFEKACEFVDIFLHTSFNGGKKYTRRIAKITTYESH